LIVAAIMALERGRESLAGACIGAATAAKAFPALLILYLAVSQRWRGAAAAILVAAALTIGAMAPYGPLEAVATVGRWFTVTLGGSTTQGFAMQKVGRLVRALHGPPAVILAAQVVFLGAVGITLLRRAPPTGALYEVGIVTLLAVLLSPVGWYYYFGLLLPAGAAAITHRPSSGRLWWIGIFVAAVLLSGVLRPLPLPDRLAFLPRHNDTVGGMILLAALISRRWHHPAAAPGRLA
jgi:hypothetical protein